ncbi:hypothetical protein SAMN04489757_106132 [Anaerocolumna aminovalerica]|uniref:Uncharacterized protein n=1 Tax=Anaerocolumna aminovalerica TaxID=1527 RepID=A0A1I5DQ14_9FIRM|nr:hypothetical protein SAMN04489757_106132 [Anaerocolumna aminovalerica]
MRLAGKLQLKKRIDQGDYDRNGKVSHVPYGG